MYYSLRPHGLQHIRPPCPSSTSGACSNSCPPSKVMPSNQLILSPFLLPSIFPSTRVSAMSQFFVSGGQSISPSNDIQDWFPLGLTSLISLQSKGLSRVFSDTTVQKHQFFSAQLSLRSSHIHTWLLENTQYYCLENSMDRGAWWAIVHGDAELGMI